MVENSHIQITKGILNLNEMAVRFEKSSNNQFVVGEINELIRLREYEVKKCNK